MGIIFSGIVWNFIKLAYYLRLPDLKLKNIEENIDYNNLTFKMRDLLNNE
jgi:hypothetical protein